ncbi:MAG TPA: YtcA family lipoprotein [Candidatus Acidoferrales bacterium]|jgi:hypothetical protein|nr:YtcA family lipoprotein [Candidatus Acidoferrales bacterium]
MMQRSKSIAILVFVNLLAAGCHNAHAPTVDVLGSYFPAWIICIFVGLVLAIISRQVLIIFKIAPHLRPAPLVYVSLAVFYTLLVWLLFYKN